MARKIGRLKVSLRHGKFKKKVLIFDLMTVLNEAIKADHVLRYCRNVHPTWVKFNSKDTKESEWCARF